MHFLSLALLLPTAAPPPQARIPPSHLAALPIRSIGPATMGGRLTSLAIVEKTPRTQYIGTAGGGVWKTTDDGLTWKPVFEGRPNPSIGAVAVSPSNSQVVWIGTGEPNARNSVSWGNGVFRTTDGGKTWAACGLADTHHIGRIVAHPTDDKTAYIAALGRLWGPNKQRGVFRTRDGGKTWQHIFALDQDTGCIDLIMDPSDPKTLFACAYCVRRDGFAGGNPRTQFGPKAGIYRTRDDGKTWVRLRRGLPTRQMGRCGLDIYRKDPKVIFAVVQTDRTDITNVAGQPPRAPGSVDTGGVFVSRDRGETWTKLNDLCPRPFYFGQIRVDPSNSSRLWVLGIPLFVSRDGGKTFSNAGAKGVHVDHHDLWINPSDGNHLILGNDGGLAYSRSGGKAWEGVKNLPIGQFYGIAVDSRIPYRIHGGLQDNGSWGGRSRTNNPAGILNSDWRRILGMDGFQCAVPFDDPLTVYAEGQYGRPYRIDLRTGKQVSIRPGGPKSRLARFNWSSPLVISPHDSKTILYGGNRLFRSLDRGATWAAISRDLTAGQLGLTYRDFGHTLTAIAESSKKAGLIYTGSDDGKIHRTDDGGKTWVDLTDRLPGVKKDRWITRVECSPFAVDTVFVSLTRHRQDDRGPHVFRSDDRGKTWRSIAANLPAEGPVLVIRCDPRRRGLLYLGTEFGLFVSLDGGGTWQQVKQLPPVAVHDVVVHPRERELVIGTHGRSLYILDVLPLQEWTRSAARADAHLFASRTARLTPAVAEQKPVARTFAGENPPPGAVFWLALATKPAALSVKVLSSAGAVVADLKCSQTVGLHRVVWDLKSKSKPVPAGTYTVQVKVNNRVLKGTVRVEMSKE